MLQRGNSFGISLIVAFAVRDWNTQNLAAIRQMAERRICVINSKVGPETSEFQVRVSHQDAGEQPGLTQDLEAVAYAEHEVA